VGLWTPGQQDGIRRGHALGLLPKYRQEGEAVGTAPTFEKSSFGDRVARLQARVLASVVGRVQNR
jgi:hypothetical protein